MTSNQAQTVYLECGEDAIGPTVCLEPGTVIGEHYVLISLLGIGGMGVVYRARHDIIDSEYALKVLAPELIDEKSWQRFIAEARALARLDHANIVKIFNMGVQGERCLYYVMELLPGRSLADRVAADGPISVVEAIDIFSAAALGLGFAHRNGIIHRDVKPSNIMLACESADRPVTVKVVDFGIARLNRGDQTLDQSLTSVGEVFGSPFYMSPEQCQGLSVDERSDIYSLGCSLFEVLTGRPPFRGESALQTLTMHVSSKPPALEDTLPGVAFDPSLEFLVAKMLKKNPSERYASMQQLEHDFERLKRNKPLFLRGESQAEVVDDASSADRLALESQERQEPDRKSSLLKWISSFILILALGISGAVAFFYFSMRPHSASFKHAEIGDKPDATSVVSTPKVASAETDRLLELKASPTITVENVRDAAGVIKRRYHFPIKQPMEATYSRNGVERLPLNGDVDLAASEQIALVWNDDENVQLLSKFDGQNVRSLQISTGNLPEVVKIIAGWPNLKFLRLMNSVVKTKDWSELDKLPKLQGLEIHKMNYDLDALKKLKYFRRIPNLRFYAGSRISVSPLLVYLAHCNGLKRLSVAQCTLGCDDILALTHIGSLHELILDGIKLEDADKSAYMLCDAHTFKKLVINPSAWPNAPRERLHEKIPGTKVVDEIKSATDDEKFYCGF